MTKVDQFESVFRSADKRPLRYEPRAVRRVLVVTDVDEAATEAFTARLERFLSALGPDVQWSQAGGDRTRPVAELIALVEDQAPDLVCTWRNLHSEAWRWPYSLGVHLDVLTQHCAAPVLVLPHPAAGRGGAHDLTGTRVVMAMSSHMTGDDSLVNAAVAFTQVDGTLWLTHVEDEQAFEHVMAAIGKIDSIDTDEARERLAAQLLKEPRDYVASCADVLKEAGITLTVESVVALGHHLPEYERLVREHSVDLLVMHTKDEDQLAMHGLAYPLAVGLVDTPLLLL